MFEAWQYPLQPQGAALKGTAEWIGGTGKFNGLSGKMEITYQKVPSAVEGGSQWTGTKVGSYSLGEITASAK